METTAGETTTATPVVTGRERVARTEAVAAPRAPGLLLCGLGLVALGVWGGIVAYVGPTFGYGPPGATAWHWSTAHTVLNLIPGAAAVAAGLLVASSFGLRRAGAAVGGLLALGAGAWFVLGAIAYPVFYGTGASEVAGAGTQGAVAYFVTRLGYSLGVGLAICLLAGMAMALMSAPLRRMTARERVAEPAEPVAGAPVARRAG